MQLDEGSASHRLTRTRILTSAGTAIDSSVGAYSLSVMGSASEGGKSSSFNYTGGSSNDLSEQHAAAYFGIEEMLRSTEGQIVTRSIDENFTGDVVLTPPAVSDLLAWLIGQLGDMQLISGNSLYRNSVGELIASPLLSLSSRFDGPGLLPVSADGCVAAPLDVIYEGRLMNLLPSLYGSRKTGLAHRPSADGWRISHGSTPRAELCDGIEHGAFVGRLSMGRPATNGDFSGVIKSSTEIVDGKQTDALSEVMISGNMASMLKDITAVSRETLDTGSEDLPWIRIQGLNFS
jgi:PmbA protein